MSLGRFLITCLLSFYFVITNVSFAAYDISVVGNKRIESAN